MSHKLIMNMAERYLAGLEPPSSPPSISLRSTRTMKQHTEVIRKSITEKARLPGGVSYFWLLFLAYIEEINHGKPRPTNTFTELEPVTFPIAESAWSEDYAAVILANVSGRDVPIATRVIAVTASFSPTTQPSVLATSATIAVINPMKISATPKAGQPPPH